MAATTPLLDAFVQAQKAFRDKLQVQDPTLYANILAVRSVDDLLIEANRIQEQIPGQRFMRRIMPFVSVLQSYGAAVDVFVQVKPELLALIWGPIRVLLSLASNCMQLFDALAKALEEASEIMPHIKVLEETFADKAEFVHSLTLFYKELFDFYLLLISQSRKFVRKRLKLLLPGFKDEVQRAAAKLKTYAELVRFKADVLHYEEARQSRIANQASLDDVKNALEVQAWLNLRSAISPMVYDRRISELRSLPDCTDWLLSNDQYIQWLDPDPLEKEDTPAWLFLHGIPGAGKTHLAASAVAYVQKRGGRGGDGGGHCRNVVLFAFIHHANKPTLTAVSVLQSLLFQVAEKDQGLQALLLQSKATVDLIGSVHDLASMLLRCLKLLAAADCYLVLDGLDEMPESQRQQLLEKLDTVAQACPELRILVSSRAEADISRELLEVRGAASICADKHNHDSIAAYVEHRLQKWVHDRPDLGPEGEKEVRRLLGRVPDKANGMFLYARIILDNLEHMYELGQIRRELTALPADLDDAYDRILQRIHEKTSVRDKCCKILGWIECAPVPMTVHEMDQAIYVNTAGDATGPVPLALAATDFVKLCGPIVEVVNGNRLQFVHFTVPCYIFHRNHARHISLTWATEELAACLLAYLASDVLDLSGLQDDDDEQQQQTIDKGLLAGKYRLLQYAAMQWPFCVYQLIRPSTESGDAEGHRKLPQPVRKLLTWLANNRANPDFEDGGDEASTREDDSGDTLPAYLGARDEEEDAEAHELLCNTLRFCTDERKWEWEWSPSAPSTWVDRDPLQTARVLEHVQQRLAILAAPYDQSDNAAEKRKTLVVKHDRHIFKCRHAFCASSLRGFSTLDDLDRHERTHQGRWKCDEPTCPKYLMGFVSQGVLRKHISDDLALHPKHVSAMERQGRSRKRKQQPDGEEPDLAHLGSAEIASLLHDAIFHRCHRTTAEVVASVQQLSALPGWENTHMSDYVALQEKLMAAAEYDFYPMKDMMAAISQPSVEGFFSIFPGAIAVALKSGDARKARWALAHRNYYDRSIIMAAALASDDNMYAIWLEFHCDTLLGKEAKAGGEWKQYYNTNISEVCDAMGGPEVWGLAERNARACRRLVELLDALKAHWQQYHLNRILHFLVEYSCSEVLAGKLLALGADINAKPRGWSVLLLAVKRAGNTQKSPKKREAIVHFIRYLLRAGADDLTSDMGKRALLKFKKRTGLSWKQLLEECRPPTDTPMADEPQADVRMVDGPTELLLPPFNPSTLPPASYILPSWRDLAD